MSLITETGEARDRLSEQAFKARVPNSPLGSLQEALELSESLQPLGTKLKQARKEGLIRSEYRGDQIEEAETAEVISKDEANQLRDYHKKVLHLLSVDDFPAGEFSKAGASTDASTTEDVDVVIPSEPARPVKKAAKKKAAKKSSKKKVSRKKAAKKTKSTG